MTRSLDQTSQFQNILVQLMVKVNAVRLLVEAGADKAKIQYVDTMISKDDRIGCSPPKPPFSTALFLLSLHPDISTSVIWKPIQWGHVPCVVFNSRPFWHFFALHIFLSPTTTWQGRTCHISSNGAVEASRAFFQCHCEFVFFHIFFHQLCFFCLAAEVLRLFLLKAQCLV